jgi:hypothetical protein
MTQDWRMEAHQLKEDPKDKLGRNMVEEPSAP